MWSLSQSSWLRREAGNGHARRRYRTPFSDQMSYRASASSTSALVWREASAHSNAAACLDGILQSLRPGYLRARSTTSKSGGTYSATRPIVERRLEGSRPSGSHLGQLSEMSAE